MEYFNLKLFQSEESYMNFQTGCAKLSSRTYDDLGLDGAIYFDYIDNVKGQFKADCIIYSSFVLGETAYFLIIGNPLQSHVIFGISEDDFTLIEKLLEETGNVPEVSGKYSGNVVVHQHVEIKEKVNGEEISHVDDKEYMQFKVFLYLTEDDSDLKITLSDIKGFIRAGDYIDFHFVTDGLNLEFRLYSEARSSKNTLEILGGPKFKILKQDYETLEDIATR